MAKNGQLERRYTSARVQQLYAAATRLAIILETGEEVPDEVAGALAVVGSLGQTVSSLRERLKIRRIIPSDNRSAQVRMAIHELVGGALGLSNSETDLIREAVEVERSAAEKSSHVAKLIKEAEQILDESRASSAAQRSFIRKANRLLQKQIDQLQESIVDPDFRDGIINRLIALYSRYLADVLKI
jgi:hypothetical protein